MKIKILFFLMIIIGITTTPQTLATFQSSYGSKMEHPLIVGHRGGFDASLPENSISNFDFTFNPSCSLSIKISRKTA